ncbi:MAG: glutathione S-transferase family protein [Lautropia sp.]
MNDETLVLYTHPQSRGRVARWMLEEAGVAYTTEYVEYGPAGMKSPAYLAINPMGKVPALRRGRIVVTENAAICAWLADAYPDAGLAPAPGDAARADYLRWLFFVAGPLESAMQAKIGGAKLEPGLAGFGRVEDVVAVLDALLSERTHVAGDRFSAADLMLASYLGWYMQTGVLEKRPAFEAYAGRHWTRPAAVRAQAIDDAEAAKRAPGQGGEAGRA